MRLAIALALFGAAMGSLAEQEPHQPPGLDPSKLAPVGSPNRSAPASLAAGFAPAVLGAGRGREDRDSGPARAVVWVDATGKTVGRADGSGTILTTYNNEPAVILGLEPDRQCDLSTGSCTYRSGGLSWPTNFRASLYYGTADCTGAPYTFPAAYSPLGVGTPIVGIAVVDGGVPYIYVSRITDTARTAVGSVLASPAIGAQATCFRAGQFADLAPVINVLPGSALGTAPFMLK
jgi:hypothetical protein